MVMVFDYNRTNICPLKPPLFKTTGAYPSQPRPIIKKNQPLFLGILRSCFYFFRVYHFVLDKRVESLGGTYPSE
jgi:hypothetical protein